MFVMTGTCVQQDKELCFIRQTPVSGTTEACVFHPPSTPTRRCRRCFRELPLSDFYTKDRRNTLDSYCKECRRRANRLRRKRMPFPSDVPGVGYPVITLIEDPAVRMAFILQALHTVRESTARKYKMLREEELLREELGSAKPRGKMCPEA